MEASMRIFLILFLYLTHNINAFADPADECRFKKGKDEVNLCMAMAHKDANSCEKIFNSETRFFCVRQIAEFSHHMFNSYNPIVVASKSK